MSALVFKLFNRKPRINTQRFYESHGTYFERIDDDCALCGQPGAQCVSQPCPYTANASRLQYNPPTDQWYHVLPDGRRIVVSDIIPEFDNWLSLCEDWSHFVGNDLRARELYELSGQTMDERRFKVEGWWGGSYDGPSSYSNTSGGSLPVPRSPTPPPPPEPQPPVSARGGFGASSPWSRQRKKPDKESTKMDYRALHRKIERRRRGLLPAKTRSGTK